MYEIWRGIKRRCGILTYGKDINKFPRYKEKKIEMSPEWAESLETFINDMGPRPSKEYSVDRIDNSKGYYKDNCRWATQKQQMNNQDRNKTVEFNGVKKTYAEWADELGLDWKLFARRVERLFTGKETVEPRGQSIVQRSLDNTIMRVFASVREAEVISGVSQAAIRKCLCKHNKTAGGFLWEYC